jgi:hypothetical protein
MTQNILSRETIPKRKYITEQTAVAFFSDPRNRLLIDAFVGDEGISIAEAAEKLAVGINAVYYKVRKMIDYGFLENCREEKRTGRPIKYYRLSANEFFLPLELSRHPTIEGHMRAVHEPIFDLTMKNCASSAEHAWSGNWGVSFTQDKDAGELFSSLHPDPPQEDLEKAHSLSYRVTHLSAKRATYLKQELRRLVNEATYDDNGDEGEEKQIYLLWSALTPIY